MLFEELIGSFLQYTDDNNATFQALKAHFAASDVFSPIHKIPFSSERKWSAIEFQNAGTFVIGAPERLGASVPPYLERDEQTENVSCWQDIPKNRWIKTVPCLTFRSLLTL